MTTVDELVCLIKDAGIARHKSDSLAAEQSLDAQGFDSYDRMSLLSELEDRYDIELPNDVANQLKSLNDIVLYLNSLS